MAYDPDAYERLQHAFSQAKWMSERKMMDGACFLLKGHMVAGVGV